MKIRNIHSINYVEAKPTRYAETLWPLASPIILDVFLGVATQSYQVMLLLMALHLSSVALGWLWFNSVTQSRLTISAQPRRPKWNKAA